MSSRAADLYTAACKSSHFANDALALSLTKGVGMFPNPTVADGRRACKYLNMALTPHPYPLHSYLELYHLATPLQMRLIDDICCHPEDFLFPALQNSSGAADEITSELLKIAGRIFDGVRRPGNEVRAMVLRNDFMLDADLSARQIEINTVSASFGGLASECTGIQEVLLDKHVLANIDGTGNSPNKKRRIDSEGVMNNSHTNTETWKGDQVHSTLRALLVTADMKQSVKRNSSKVTVNDISNGTIIQSPPSGGAESAGEIQDSLACRLKFDAHENTLLSAYRQINNPAGFGRVFTSIKSTYLNQFPTSANRELACLFVVDEDEKNELDHRKMEFGIYQEAGMVSIRRSFAEINPLFSSGSLYFAEERDDAGAALIFEEKDDNGETRKLYEICVVYFRTGHWPGQYRAENGKSFWDTRYQLERSRAAKIPNVLYQLAGMKKIQQLLCEHDASLEAKFPKYWKRGAMVSGGEFPQGLTLAMQGNDASEQLFLNDVNSDTPNMNKTCDSVKTTMDRVYKGIHTDASCTPLRAKNILSRYFAHQFDPNEEVNEAEGSLQKRQIEEVTELSNALREFATSTEVGLKWGADSIVSHVAISLFPQIFEVLQSPDDFVMKSQIEGSGAVIFDDDMIRILAIALYDFTRVRLRGEPIKLEEVMNADLVVKSANNLGEFIIMKKIRPPAFPSIVLKPDETKCTTRDAIGELGLYGGFVAGAPRAGGCTHNETYGHLLRSKGVSTKQGGVFMGHACVDAPLLF